MGNPCVSKMAPFRYLLTAKDCPNLGHQGDARNDDAENVEFLASIRGRDIVCVEDVRLSMILPKFPGNRGQPMCLQMAHSLLPNQG